MSRVVWHEPAAWTGLVVDREQCRRQVEQVARELVDGRSAVLLVHAPTGCGLTTVLELAAQAARAQGARVAWARCSPDESGHAFAAAEQLLSALGIPGTRDVRAVLEAARSRPLALLIDDVQWIDPESASLLVALARRTRHAPIVLVVGNGVPGASSSCADVASSTGARVLESHPQPLSREAVARLVASACPVPAEPGFVDEIMRWTAGYPYPVRQVLLALARQSTPPVAGVEVLEIARLVWQEQVDQRLDTLPPSAHLLLAALALCHGVFGVRQAAQVAGLGADFAAEAEVLTTSGMLVDDSIPHDEVIADLVLAATPRDVREALYAAAASLAHRTALPDSTVARFVLGAAPLGAPWVVEVLRNAAAASSDRRYAVRLLERALAEPLSSSDRAALLVACGAVETPLAPDAGERKLAAVVSGGGVHRLAAAELILARGNIDLLRRLSTGADLGGLYWLADEARHQHPELVAVPWSSDPVDTVSAASLAWAEVTAGRDLERARELARLTLGGPISREPLLLPWVLAARALSFTGDVAESTGALDAIIIEARRRCLPAVTGWALVTRASTFARLGRSADAAHDLDQALREIPLEHWHSAVRPVFAALELVLALEEGRPGAAALDFPMSFNRVQFDFARGLVRLVGGDFAGAAALFEECGRVLLARRWSNPALLPWRSFCAIAYRGCGRLEEAYSLAGEEIALASEWGEASAVGGAHLGAALVFDRVSAGEHRDRGVAVLRAARAPLRHSFVLAEVGAELDGEDVRELVARRVPEPSVSAESLFAQAARAIW